MSVEITSEKVIEITVVKESKPEDLEKLSVFHNNFGDICQKLYSYHGFRSINHESNCKFSKGRTSNYVHTYIITFIGRQDVERLIYDIRSLF